MNDDTKKCIQEAANLIDKGIYSYSENDDGFNGFMETISIVTRMIESQCHKCDREAYKFRAGKPMVLTMG